MTIDSSMLALQRIYHWESTTPNDIYLTQPMGQGVVKDFTWAQTMAEVRRMAAHLQSFGWPPGTRIAILSKNCAHWIMTDFAIWMAGYVSVPLYPTLAPDTIRRILEHSESKLLFVGKLDGWQTMKPGVPADLPCITYPLSPPEKYPGWDDLVARTAPLAGNPLRPADDLCTIIYTSGTTGIPKGVMHSFGTFAAAVKSGLSRNSFNDGERLVSYLPLAHVAERVLIEHGSLVTRVRVFFAEALDTFAADLQRARPTVFFSVPRLWVKFQQGIHTKIPAEKLDRLLRIPIVRGIVRKKILAGLGLDQCRIASGGASPMPPALLEFFNDKLGLPMTEAYGMTENAAVSHASLVGKLRPGTVGQAWEGVQCRIDPVTGEVQTRSGGQMLGYYREPELTRQALTADGWLKTGDKGSFDAEGNLRITGRVKDLFKTSKGKYVAPAPIEDRLVMHPAIEACIVTGASLPQPLGIVMISAEAAQASRADNRAALTASLAEHLKKVNASLDPHEHLDCLVATTEAWTVENDLVTPTLKVKRNRIDETFGASYERWTGQKQAVVWA